MKNHHQSTNSTGFDYSLQSSFNNYDITWQCHIQNKDEFSYPSLKLLNKSKKTSRSKHHSYHMGKSSRLFNRKRSHPGENEQRIDEIPKIKWKIDIQENNNNNIPKMNENNAINDVRNDEILTTSHHNDIRDFQYFDQTKAEKFLRDGIKIKYELKQIKNRKEKKKLMRREQFNKLNDNDNNDNENDRNDRLVLEDSGKIATVENDELEIDLYANILGFKDNIEKEFQLKEEMVEYQYDDTIPKDINMFLKLRFNKKRKVMEELKKKEDEKKRREEMLLPKLNIKTNDYSNEIVDDQKSNKIIADWRNINKSLHDVEEFKKKYGSAISLNKIQSENNENDEFAEELKRRFEELEKEEIMKQKFMSEHAKDIFFDAYQRLSSIHDDEINKKRIQKKLSPRSRFIAYCIEHGLHPEPFFLNNKQSTTLSFAHFSLGDKKAYALARSLPALKGYILEIDLSSNRLSDQSLLRLLKVLNELNLEKINISKNHFKSEKSAIALGLLLSRTKTLKSIDISSIDLTDDLIMVIAHVFENNHKYTKDVTDKIFDDSTNVTPFISRPASRENNNNNEIDGEIKNSLNLTSNVDSKEQPLHIKRNSSLKELFMSNNELSGRRGGLGIAILMKGFSNLEKLDLSFNHLSQESMLPLSRAIQDDNSIKSIDLSMNNIGDEGLCYFFESLRVNKILEKLNASHTGCGGKAAFILAKSLMINRTIREIKLQGNSLTEAGGRALFRSYLWIDRNDVKLDITNCTFERNEKSKQEYYYSLFDYHNPANHFLLNLTHPYDRCVLYNLAYLGRHREGFEVLYINYTFSDMKERVVFHTKSKLSLEGQTILFDNPKKSELLRLLPNQLPFKPFINDSVGIDVLNERNLKSVLKKALNVTIALSPLATPLQSPRDEENNKKKRQLRISRTNLKLLNQIENEKVKREEEKQLEKEAINSFVERLQKNTEIVNQEKKEEEKKLEKINVKVRKKRKRGSIGRRLANSVLKRTSTVSSQVSLNKALSISNPAVSSRSNEHGLIDIRIRTKPEAPFTSNFHATNIIMEKIVGLLNNSLQEELQSKLLYLLVKDLYITTKQAQYLLNSFAQPSSTVTLSIEKILATILPRIADGDFKYQFLLFNLRNNSQRFRLSTIISIELYKFNYLNATGHYRILLENQNHREVLSQLISLNRIESLESKKSGRNDTSQYGTWSNWRNEYFNGNSIEITPSLLDALPYTGLLEFDYVSTTRPSSDIVAVTDDIFQKFLEELGITKKFTNDDENLPFLLVELQNASCIGYFCIEQVLKVFNFFPEEYFCEIAVIFFARVIDLHDFDRLLDEMTESNRGEVINRLGLLNIMNPLKIEGDFLLRRKYHDERVLLKLLLNLGTHENHGKNLSFDSKRSTVTIVELYAQLNKIVDETSDTYILIKYGYPKEHNGKPNWKLRRSLIRNFLIGCLPIPDSIFEIENHWKILWEEEILEPDRIEKQWVAFQKSLEEELKLAEAEELIKITEIHNDQVEKMAIARSRRSSKFSKHSFTLPDILPRTRSSSNNISNYSGSNLSSGRSIDSSPSSGPGYTNSQFFPTPKASGRVLLSGRSENPLLTGRSIGNTLDINFSDGMEMKSGRSNDGVRMIYQDSPLSTNSNHSNKVAQSLSLSKQQSRNNSFNVIPSRNNSFNLNDEHTPSFRSPKNSFNMPGKDVKFHTSETQKDQRNSILFARMAALQVFEEIEKEANAIKPRKKKRKKRRKKKQVGSGNKRKTKRGDSRNKSNSIDYEDIRKKIIERYDNPGTFSYLEKKIEIDPRNIQSPKDRRISKSLASSLYPKPKTQRTMSESSTYSDIVFLGWENPGESKLSMEINSSSGLEKNLIA